MKKRFFLTLTVLIACFALTGCNYNTLTVKQQDVRKKWSDVENEFQRRADLIPNLFEAAKAAGIQEQEVFGQIAEARSRLLDAKNAAPEGDAGDKSPEQKQAIIDANNSFGGTIGRLLSIVENYPDLKSTESFKMFQVSLEGTENRIAVARGDYNKSVQDYNTTRNQFPAVIFASLYGFKEEPYFKAEERAKQAPKIDANDMRKDKK